MTEFVDFFGRKLRIGDYCVFVGAKSGKFDIVKIVSLTDRIEIRSLYYQWNDQGAIARPGHTPYGGRLIIANDLVSDTIKQVFIDEGV